MGTSTSSHKRGTNLVPGHGMKHQHEGGATCICPLPIRIFELLAQLLEFSSDTRYNAPASSGATEPCLEAHYSACLYKSVHAIPQRLCQASYFNAALHHHPRKVCLTAFSHRKTFPKLLLGVPPSTPTWTFATVSILLKPRNRSHREMWSTNARKNIFFFLFQTPPRIHNCHFISPLFSHLQPRESS